MKYKERVQTRQLRTRPKTAIKTRDKQTTSSFYRPAEEAPLIVLTIVGIHLRVISQRSSERRIVIPLPSPASPCTVRRFSASEIFLLRGIRFAFDLSRRERTTRGVPAYGSVAVRFDRIFQGPRVCAPRARARIKCRSYRSLKQLSSRPTTMLPTVGRAAFCHIAINH